MSWRVDEAGSCGEMFSLGEQDSQRRWRPRLLDPHPLGCVRGPGGEPATGSGGWGWEQRRTEGLAQGWSQSK